MGSEVQRAEQSRTEQNRKFDIPLRTLHMNENVPMSMIALKCRNGTSSQAILNLPEQTSIVPRRITMSSSQKGSYTLIPGSIGGWSQFLHLFPFSIFQTTAYISTVLISILIGLLWGSRGDVISSPWATDCKYLDVTRVVIIEYNFWLM